MQWGIFVGPDNILMLPVKSVRHYFKYLVSERVQAYSSKIILYFQLQKHEYFYSGVTMVLGLQAPSPSLLI